MTIFNLKKALEHLYYPQILKHRRTPSQIKNKTKIRKPVKAKKTRRRKSSPGQYTRIFSSIPLKDGRLLFPHYALPF
jgi:hypothetical protein